MPAAADRPGTGARWISPLECSHRLGLHVQSVYQMISRGDLKAGRIGRVLRVDWLAVEKGLEEGQAQAPANPPTLSRTAPRKMRPAGKIRDGMTA